MTTAPGLQLSWADGDVVAWQPGRSVYGGNLSDQVGRLAGRRWYGQFTPRSVGVLDLRLPSGTQQVMCQRLDVAALDALAATHLTAGDASPSVVWFATLYRAVDSLVRNGRVVPSLRKVGDGRWEATWRPAADDVAAITAALAPTMPPVAAAGGSTDPTAIVHSLTDGVARGLLAAARWRSPVSRRTEAGRALTAVTKALAAPTPYVDLHPDLETAVAALAEQFEHIARRAAGEPVLRARLRLGLPDEAEDSMSGRWPLDLELVDADDPGRWCTAENVEARSPAAVALAGSAQRLTLLGEHLRLATHRLLAAAPYLAEWLDDPFRGLTLEHAAALLEGVDDLVTAGIELVASQRLTRRRVLTQATVTAGNSSGHVGATALMQWRAVIDDVEVDELQLRRAAEQAAGLIEIGGRWVQVDRTQAQRALANLAEHRARHGEIGALELLQLAAQLGEELSTGETPADDTIIAADADGWVADLLGGLPESRLADADSPPEFTATLRPYQRRGLSWLQFLHSLGLGGCLADDMGLGKTPTTLAHLAGLPGPHLVVCPLSVVHNWETETGRFAPFMRVMVHHGPARSTDEQFHRRVAEHDLVVSTYQVVARDIDTISAVAWSTVVLDEAQAVKNPDTRSARAVRRLPAGQRIALTGTPVENRLSELWSILSVVTPGLLGSAAQFKQRFADPIERDRSPAATATLRQLTSPFLLRRTKADKSLVPDLPDMVEQLAWATLTREQATMYQRVVDQLLHDAQQESGMRRRGLVLAALTRLKQICNHPAHALGDGSRLAGRSGKLHRYDELITDLLDAGEQALVFTQFREMGLLLQRHMADRFDQQVPFLHGGVTKQRRDRMVAEFQQGQSGSPLLLVSLKAGGTGLNLTAASRVVHYDRWWNPAVEDQATDRAWRIGQQQSVFVHKLVCEGTVEERVDQLINDKRALADAVVGTTGEAWLSELSTDALRDLVVLHRSAVRD
jgi:hypothetical protein